MARVLALTADLLFGSRVQGALGAAGNEVELIARPERLRERLRDRASPTPAVVVIDLTSAEIDGASLRESLAGEGSLEGVRTVGFYAHVDARARERAERAGFDLVVPRSRMSREGARLVGALADSAAPPSG